MSQTGLSADTWEAFSTPGSIALVGASERITGVSFTNRFLLNNEQLGYGGKIHLINPTKQTIFGRPCAPNLSTLQEPPAAVIVNVPARKVHDVVHEAIKVGARALMVHSGGFAEAGAGGLRLQEQIALVCARANVGLIGPNCLGLVSIRGQSALYGSPLPPDLKSGPVCAITQSGSVATSFLALGAEYGMSFLASTGNEAVTTMEDLLERAVDDADSRVIVLFLETVRQPERFMRAALRAAAVGKPIIALKVGRTSQGGRVSRGHTGAITGSAEVYRQAFAQCGIMEVEDFDELQQTVRLILRLRGRPDGDRIALLGTSGGKLAAITDTAVELGFKFSPFNASTVQHLQEALSLPSTIEAQNPLDVGIGFRSKLPYGERFQQCMRAVAADDSVDLIAVMQDLNSNDDQRNLNDEIVEAAAVESAQLAKPVVVLSCHSSGASEALVSRATKLGVPVMTGGRASLRAIRHVTRPSRPIQPALKPPTEGGKKPLVVLSDLQAVPYSQPQAFTLLAASGLPVVPMRRVVSEADAVEALNEFGPPVVLKVDAATIIHKSDIGGVRLNITDEEGARAAFVALSNVPIDADEERDIVVSPQLDPGLELYAGAKWDATFGPVLAFGLGGRLVEFLSRTALAVAPSTEEQIIDLIDRSGLQPLLRGYRSGPVAALDVLVDTLLRLSSLATAFGDRLEAIDLNPIIVNQKHPGGRIVDARILIVKGYNHDKL